MTYVMAAYNYPVTAKKVEAPVTGANSRDSKLAPGKYWTSVREERSECGAWTCLPSFVSLLIGRLKATSMKSDELTMITYWSRNGTTSNSTGDGWMPARQHLVLTGMTALAKFVK